MHLSESQAKSYNSNHYKHSTQRKISEMNQYFLRKKKKGGYPTYFLPISNTRYVLNAKGHNALCICITETFPEKWKILIQAGPYRRDPSPVNTSVEYTVKWKYK